MDVPLTPYPIWPFVLALATAIGFGLIALRMQRSKVTWIVGGGLFGLVTATFTSGIANAVAVPYTPPVIASHQLFAATVSVIILGVTAFLLSRSSS